MGPPELDGTHIAEHHHLLDWCEGISLARLFSRVERASKWSFLPHLRKYYTSFSGSPLPNRPVPAGLSGLAYRDRALGQFSRLI